jgi:hypothetical protein
MTWDGELRYLALGRGASVRSRPRTHLIYRLDPQEGAMKFLLMIYSDDSLMEALPAGQFETMMRSCLGHADELREQGRLKDFQQLEAPSTAKAVRVRNQRMTVVDGPFAETKEYLAGFNLIEAADMDEAVRMAAEFPWTATGCVEVRPIRDVDAVRRRVGA